MGRKAISNTFSVTTVEDGKRGKVGRFFYYAGDFDEDNDTKGFLVNDAQSPFFSHVDSGGITRFHVFNPETNPPLNTMTMAAMWAESNGNWNNAPWEAMTDDFKYLITEALFSNFAHLGGAIISGDWMISQHGTINGVQSTEYTLFDADYPNVDHTYQDQSHNFIPNYSVNLLSGHVYQNYTTIRNKLYKPNFIINSSNFNNYTTTIYTNEVQRTVLDLSKIDFNVQIEYINNDSFYDNEHHVWLPAILDDSMVGYELSVLNLTGYDIVVTQPLKESGGYFVIANTLIDKSHPNTSIVNTTISFGQTKTFKALKWSGGSSGGGSLNYCWYILSEN